MRWLDQHVILSFFGGWVLAAVPATAQFYPLFITEVMSSNESVLADEDGDFEDWVEFINFSGIPINLDGVGLSDDLSDPFKWTFGDVIIEPFEFLVVFASGKDRPLHTNFAIKSSGEDLVLTAPDGTTLDAFFTGDIPRDVSRGRHQDAPIEWPYFVEPTPGALNDTPWFLGLAGQPEISVDSGLVASPIDVVVTPASSEDQVFFSLNGSTPTAAHTPVTGPISISETTVLRVITLRDQFIPSRVESRVYFFGEVGDLPIVTLVTDPGLLFDPETGIYMLGPDPGDPPFFFGANYRLDIEIPVYATMFETDGTVAFGQDAGLEIQGNVFSRFFPKKAFKIKARARFGKDVIDYNIFPDKDVGSFRTILLRPSERDQYGTLFRDALAQNLLDVTSLDYQSYRPAILMINDEYWGIYNLRETAVADYLHDNYGLEEDEIDLVENSAREYNLRQGTWHAFGQLVALLTESDLSDPSNYEQVKAMVDIENFLDYFAAEIYVGNTDWPGNNRRFWRRRVEGGKWRFLVYDLDLGFATENLFHDTISFATNDQPTPPDVIAQNPPEATFVLRALLTNDEFREEFIRRMSDMMNIVYEPARVIARIDAFQLGIWNEMPNEQQRWWTVFNPPIPFEHWFSKVHELRIFAIWRPFVMQFFIAQHFGLTGPSTLTIGVAPPGTGHVRVNSQVAPDYPFHGMYFREIPLKLTAIPGAGFVFSGWSGDVDSNEEFLLVDMSNDVVLTANFMEDDSPPMSSVVFNEINYNSADAFEVEDWVELHNHGDQPVDLSAWSFKDQGNINSAETGFVFPIGTAIGPGGFLVLCNQVASFQAFFPGVDCLPGFDYGLSGGGDFIALYDDLGNEVDALTYDDHAPWPNEADGDGPTLELVDPALDNALPESWQASVGHGTPGSANSFP